MQEIKSKVSGIVFVAVLVLLGAVNPVFIKSAEASIRIHSRANCFAGWLPGYIVNESITWDDTFTARRFKTATTHYESGIYKHYKLKDWTWSPTWNDHNGDFDWNRGGFYYQSWSTKGDHWIRVNGFDRWLGTTYASRCFDYGWGKIVYVPGL